MKPTSMRLMLLGLAAFTVTAVAFGQEARPSPEKADKRPDEARSEKLKQQYSDGSAVRNRLVMLRVGQNKKARPVVMLRRPVSTKDIPDHDGAVHLDILPRELVRQAVLIAARDELGLVTRDLVIGDSPAESAIGKEGEEEHVEVVSFIRDRQLHERIYRVANEHVESLFAHDTPVGGQAPDLDMIKLIATAEAQSRQDFPKALRSLGLHGKSNGVKEGAAPDLPRQVEGQLSSLGFSQTLAAVRELHMAMRSSGETPSVVGALVRGYAQLGVLSEFHWNPAHKAFKARALLYAQRLVAHDPKQPWGLWHRAFAMALVGYHRDALADLDEAKKLAGPAAKPPAWLALIDAAARCDVRRLTGQQGPHERLAALLRMITLEFPTTTAISLRAAREVVILDPLCFRAHDAMCQYEGVSNLHVATEVGPQVLQQVFAADLASLKTLPASLKDRLGAQPEVVALADMLAKAGASDADDGEPSWGALAQMIRETRFVQVARRLEFMKVWWGVPVDEYWNQVRAEVATHRYRPFLETLVLPPREKAQKYLEIVEKIDLTDIENTSYAMNRNFSGTQRPRGKAAWEMTWAHMDSTTRELSLTQSHEQVKYHAARAHEIMKVSPYNPYARRTLIEQEWDKVKDDVKTWEKEAGDAPAVLGAIGFHFSAQKQYDDAQRALTRYIELSPDLWAYRRLAENFRDQGKIDRWQETLDDFLNKVEDLGLDHSNVRIEVADYFMARKEWDKAAPYAEEAAQSWSQRSMACARGARRK